MKSVQLKKTTLIDVTAAQVVAITATLDDGTNVAIPAPVIVSDWIVTNTASGEVSVMTDAEFRSEEVG